MRKIRNCSAGLLDTGVSKCQLDFGRIKGAIIVEHGTKLPAELTGNTLEELVHEDRSLRVFGLPVFTEYAKNGGEAQTASNGYGGTQVTGFSDRIDDFTLDDFYPELMASLTKTSNHKWDAYYFDDNNVLYGVNDGTDILAGFAMNCIYADATPHRTSSEKATMTVHFAHSDAKESFEKLDFVELDFNPHKFVLGLTPVELVSTGTANQYKLVEKVGGYDCTADFGQLIADAGASCISGTTSAVSYDSDADVLTITVTDGSTPTLKSPKVLYAESIKGIVQAS